PLTLTCLPAPPHPVLPHHPALYSCPRPRHLHSFPTRRSSDLDLEAAAPARRPGETIALRRPGGRRVVAPRRRDAREPAAEGRSSDRKSTRLNSSHVSISYAVFCLKKKNNYTTSQRMTSSILGL